MSEENLVCPICGGLHPAGHRDKELEDRLEAAKDVCEQWLDHKGSRDAADILAEDILHTLRKRVNVK